MCCGKSFISSGFYMKLKADITLHFSAVNSLVFICIHSCLRFVRVTHFCLRLQEGDECSLGKDFLSVCNINYAHLLSLNNYSLSLSVCLFSIVLSHSYVVKHTHTHTPLGPNHCKQQIVVNASPRSACRCVVKRKKLICALWLINLMGFSQ